MSTSELENVIQHNCKSNLSSEELSESWKSKLEFAIKSLDAHIWEYDIEKDILFSEDPTSSLVGGVGFEQYILIHHPDDRVILRKSIHDLICGQTDRLSLDLRLRQTDGSYIWIKVHGMVSKRDGRGRAIHIIGLRRTIEDQVKANIELIESKRRLEEYTIKSKLSMALGDIWMWDYDIKSGVVSLLDPATDTRQQMLRADAVAVVYRDDMPELLVGINKLKDGDATHFTCQVRLIMSPGLRWMEFTATVLSRDGQNEPTDLTGLLRDVTKEHVMMAELVQLRNQADKANQLKTAFLANMSHEIRTPLNAIVGFSNLIVSSVEHDESLAQYGKLIEFNNNLLTQLINDILDMSKIEAGKLDFIMSEICVNELMEQLQQMFSMRVDRDLVSVVFDPPTQQCYIVSERNRLTQVITNFLSNAVKFTSHGSIHLGYKKYDDELYFYVRDTGKGISKGNLPAIFDRFAKFDSSIPGTGLGLSISQMIVERLGGKIGVESQEGMGAKFWFTLPCIIHEVSSVEQTFDE
ncbi:MAG: ATP-binding protein [Mucinivorans sp.]